VLKRLYDRLQEKRHGRHAGRATPPGSGQGAPTLVVWKREASPDLFYVFQGRKQRLMMEPLTFLRTTGLLDANLVLVRDPHHAFYHAGISDELPDFEAVRERLRERRRQLPRVRRTCCLGTSMGGYAAILFGHHLRADAVFAFAPQTLLDLGRLQADGAYAITARTLRNLERRGVMAGRARVAHLPDEHRDLALLLAHYNGHTRYKVFFSEGSTRDRAFAERIGGLGGVELYPQPGSHHNVVQEMARRGLLSEALLAR
jgi:hypothetical protein